MSRRLFLFAIVAPLLVFTIGTAEAQWTQFQRDEFMNGCVPACRNNPDLYRRWANRCDAYCTCVMREGESRFSSAEYEILERDARDNVQSRMIQEFATIYPGCRQRIFTD